MTFEETLLSKIKKTETCWLWLAGTNKKGYGRIWNSNINRKELAHRASYRLFKDDFDPDLCVLHRCDNPPCVRPSHLFQGTEKDNTADAMRKGRMILPFRHPGFHAKHFSGIKNHQAKLTEKEVLEIRRLSAAGVKGVDLVEQFPISGSSIYRIINKLSWKHIEESDIESEIAESNREASRSLPLNCS